MGPVKNPPSPQPNLRKDHSSTVSEDMAPAAKSRRLLNSCLNENQKICITEIPAPTLILSVDEKKLDETSKPTIHISYLNENNENAVSAVQKSAGLNTIVNNSSMSMSSGDMKKGSSDVTKLTDLTIFDSSIGSNVEKLENGTVDGNCDDHESVENHNSNNSSSPQDMNSPMDVKEKMPSLCDWTKDIITSSLELSSSVKDTLSEMMVESDRFCQESTRQFANTYFSQTSSSVDKLIEHHVSSQGGMSASHSPALRRYCSSVERDHKFIDSFVKPHLNALKAELEVDSDSTEESSDEEMNFPSSVGNMVSGNESSSLPQSPASTISDFSNFSANVDLTLPSQAHVVVEKTFPAERNYLRRRSEMHSRWVWLSIKYKYQKRQLKRLNQLFKNLQKIMQTSQGNTRRREQLTRSSSPESTPTLFTGPSTPVSEASAADGDSSFPASCVNGSDDASMTSARVRPYVWEKPTLGLSPTRPQTSRSVLRPYLLTRYNELIDSVSGPSSVQCHCQYPEIYPCIVCCGGHVDRELNPSIAAKTTRLQLPPPEKIYPRHKLDLSYHEKLSRSSDLCHSLSYDESFVSRRPRMVFLSESLSQRQSLPSVTTQARQQNLHAEQTSSTHVKQSNQLQQLQQPQQQPAPQQAQQHQQKQHSQHLQQRQHQQLPPIHQQRTETNELSSEVLAKQGPKRFEHSLNNGDHHDEPQLDRQCDTSSRILAHSPYMRRRRGRRKQHPYSRTTIQHGSGSSYYTQSNEEMDYNDSSMHEDNHRPHSNFCKQRLAQQLQQHSRSRSLYRQQPNQQWSHHQRHSQVHHHQQQPEPQTQYRNRIHHQKNPFIQQQQQQHQHQQRQAAMHSRRGIQHGQQHQQEQCRGPYQQKQGGNRQLGLTNQQLVQRSKVRLNLDTSMSTESSLLSPQSSSVQLRSDINHSHQGGGMRSLVVNISSAVNSSDLIGAKDHAQSSNDSHCVLARSGTCTTVPVATRRPVPKVGLYSTSSSIPDEDTASVSSSGGSVKSMRSVSSSRLDVCRRSEDNSIGLRSLSAVSDSLRQSDSRLQTDIETPVWRRLSAGITAAPEESAVMHLLSVGAVNSVREREVSDPASAECFNSNELKASSNSSDVASPFHLVMLDQPESITRIEDTTDVVFIQRHKSGEARERASNVSNGGSNGRSKAVEGLCLQSVTNEFNNDTHRKG